MNLLVMRLLHKYRLFPLMHSEYLMLFNYKLCKLINDGMINLYKKSFFT